MLDQKTQEMDAEQVWHATPGDVPARATQGTKADLGNRAIAAVIDAVIGIGLGWLPAVGGLLAGAYWLLRDGLEFEFMKHRSVGKHLMKLRLVKPDGSPLDIATSVKRNWMFALGGVAQLLLWIPFIGWLFVIPVILVAFAVGIVELVLVFTDPEGRRLGDKMANTKVVEVG